MRSGIREDALQVMFEGGAVHEGLVNRHGDVTQDGPAVHKVTQQRLELLLLADFSLLPTAAMGRSLPVMLAKGADKSVQLPRCQRIGISRPSQR